MATFNAALKYLTLAGVNKALDNSGYGPLEDLVGGVRFKELTPTGNAIYEFDYRTDEFDREIDTGRVFVWIDDAGELAADY